MTFNHSKLGKLVVQQVYLENMKLKRGGTLSLYWTKNEAQFVALIIRRTKLKVFMSQVLNSWEEAKRVFTSRIIREGALSPRPRNFHTLSLYIGPDPHSDMQRCIAICREGKKFVDTLHKTRIGSLALAFQGMRRECGCKHRKRYDELDYHTFHSRVSQSTTI